MIEDMIHRVPKRAKGSDKCALHIVAVAPPEAASDFTHRPTQGNLYGIVAGD
jgi:hypothetical protein